MGNPYWKKTVFKCSGCGNTLLLCKSVGENSIDALYCGTCNKTVYNVLYRACWMCAYWCGIGATGCGQCRKMAPVLSSRSSLWPTTEKEDWCGDFEFDCWRIIEGGYADG